MAVLGLSAFAGILLDCLLNNIVSHMLGNLDCVFWSQHSPADSILAAQ